MALENWLAMIKADVSPVSAVQAPIHRNSGRYVTVTADESDVSGTGTELATDTADTAGKTQGYQPQPAWLLGCTADTADTAGNVIRGEKRGVAANEPPIQAAYWPNSSAMNDSEIDLMEARLKLITWRGMADAEADQLVDKLMQADRDQSGLVSCYLCRHFNPTPKTCGNSKSAGVGQEIGADLAAMLQRCPAFHPMR